MSKIRHFNCNRYLKALCPWIFKKITEQEASKKHWSFSSLLYTASINLFGTVKNTSFIFLICYLHRFVSYICHQFIHHIQQNIQMQANVCHVALSLNASHQGGTSPTSQIHFPQDSWWNTRTILVTIFIQQFFKYDTLTDSFNIYFNMSRVCT